jgi:hypothetical protein
MLRRSSAFLAAVRQMQGVVNPCIVTEPLNLQGRGLSEEPVEQFKQVQMLMVQLTFVLSYRQSVK